MAEKYSVTKYHYGITKYITGVCNTPPDKCRVKFVFYTHSSIMGSDETHQTINTYV